LGDMLRFVESPRAAIVLHNELTLAALYLKALVNVMSGPLQPTPAVLVDRVAVIGLGSISWGLLLSDVQWQGKQVWLELATHVVRLQSHLVAEVRVFHGLRDGICSQAILPPGDCPEHQASFTRFVEALLGSLTGPSTCLLLGHLLCTLEELGALSQLKEIFTSSEAGQPHLIQFCHRAVELLEEQTDPLSAESVILRHVLDKIIFHEANGWSGHFIAPTVVHMLMGNGSDTALSLLPAAWTSGIKLSEIVHCSSANEAYTLVGQTILKLLRMVSMDSANASLRVVLQRADDILSLEDESGEQQAFAVALQHCTRSSRLLRS